MGACEAVKNPNEKIIKSNLLSEMKNENNEEIKKENPQINNNNKDNELKKNEQSNINTNKEYAELESPNIESDLYPLRRRQRLRSENIAHPNFHFLSEKKNDEQNDNNDKDNKNEKTKTPIFKTTKNNSLTFQRMQSMKYCNDFKKKTQTGSGKYLLNHLANSLLRNTIGENKPKNPKYYRPEFVNDWRYVKNETTNISIWKNFGQIPLTQELINSFIDLDIKEISKSEHFFKKRIWLMNYIMNHFPNTNDENPILVINRKNILEESFNQFMTTKDLNLKEPIQIHFVDEVANDAGGVYREWYSCLFKEIFNSKNKLFIENTNNACFNGTYLIYPKYDNMKMDYYEFFGKLAAKALIDSVNISEILNRTLLNYLKGEKVVLDDMKYYDLDLYNSLKQINEIEDINSNDSFKEFKFVWNLKDENGNIKEVELIPGGSKISLSNENKNLFIEKIIYVETLMRYEEQIKRLRKGFLSLLGQEINIFKPEEFDFLISGQRTIDLEDWKKNTIYKGHYNANHQTIKFFWQVLSELSQNDLFIFYFFCTSSTHVPIDGFNSLKGVNNKIQKFTIEPKLSLILDESGENKFKLIEAKTCFNRIYLPEYGSIEEMRKAIDIIIGNDTQFFGLE